MQKTNFREKIILYMILSIIGIICLFPYAWLLSSSLKPESRIFEVPPRLIPQQITLSNYYGALYKSPLLTWLGNSLYITLIVVGIGTFVASAAGFAYAKVQFPGSSFLFLLPLCAMMVPNEVIIVPLFRLWSALGFANTHVPLIVTNIVGVGGMYGVFLFRQFYLTVPLELYESGKLDGCTPFGVYVRIMFPISQSIVVTLMIYNFINTWNDFLDPLVYLNSTDKYTVSLGLSLYSDSTGLLWGNLMAACVFATLPLIIMFFILQDKFIESVAISGMKN